MERLKDFYSVKAASRATGLKYKTLLQRIKRGKVTSERFGSQILVPTTEVERLKKERASC